MYTCADEMIPNLVEFIEKQMLVGGSLYLGKEFESHV